MADRLSSSAQLWPDRLDLSTTSFPVYRAARHFGIPIAYAYPIADMMLQILADHGALGIPPHHWPKDHPLHVWACNSVGPIVGAEVMNAFGRALLDHFVAVGQARVRR